MAWKNKEEQALYAKKYREANKERLAKINKEYRLKNPQLKEYSKNYYQNNKQKWNNYNKDYIERIGKNAFKQYRKEYSRERYEGYKTWLDEVKSVPCADCGNEFPPVCMQFDHIPERGEKKFCLSLGYGRSDEDINAEYAKCEIVCANCHMIRTHILRKQPCEVAPATV